MKKDLDLFFDNFTSPSSQADQLGPYALGPPKFMVEAHDGYVVGLEGSRRYAARMQEARRVFGERGWECPISIIFIREPLPLYISLYRYVS